MWTRLRHSLLVDGSEELKTRLDLLLRLVRLDDCADDRDVDVLRADVVRGGDLCDVDIYRVCQTLDIS